jgi:hypothetical protein
MLFSVEEGLDLMDQQQVDQIIEDLLVFANDWAFPADRPPKISQPKIAKQVTNRSMRATDHTTAGRCRAQLSDPLTTWPERPAQPYARCH